MSVAVQTRQDPAKFGVNSAQFEEIVAPKDERKSISNHESPTSKMDKGSDSNKEGNKNSKKSDSKPDYSTDEDSYDDDFEESDLEKSRRKLIGKDTARKSPKRNSSPETARTKSPSVISPRSNKKGKTRKRFKPYESPRSSSPATSRLPPEKYWGKPKNRSANFKSRPQVSKVDHTVVDRVLSANRHKVTKLESRLSQLIKELTKEREENRTLRAIQHRQERKLEKVIGEEAELPQLLVKHTAEVKSLRERVRRLQDVSHQKDEKLSEQDKQILKLKDRCKYYKDLCEDEELTERADLQKKVSRVEDDLKKRDEEISKLQRMLNLKEKTHTRNLKENREKLREAQEKLQLMQDSNNNLQGRLKVREKQLDYTNIYQRQIVVKEKNPMLPQSPPRMAALPAPKRKPKGKNNDTTTTTIGNKGKETNSKGDGNKNGGSIAKDSEEEANKKPNSVFLTAQSDKESGSDRDIDKKLLSITDGKNGGQPMVNGNNGLSDHEIKEEVNDFEKSLREEDERLRKEKEGVEKRLKELAEREKREKAEREEKWREDSAKRAREAEERQQETARRHEEERRKEEKRKEEERIIEQRKEEERRREERKEQERREQEKKSLPSEDSFFEDEQERRKKDALLAKLKAMDGDNTSDEPFEKKKGKSGDDSPRPHASKSYEARKADQNLHNGLPTVPKKNHVISPPESVKSDPDGVFGVPRHKPVLIGRGNLAKKKSNQTNQFSWLDDNKKPAPNKAKPANDVFNFGDYSPSTGHDNKKSDGWNGDILDTGLSRNAGGAARRRGGGQGDNGIDFGDPWGSGGRRGSGGVDKPKQNNSLEFLSDDFGSKRGGEQTNGLASNNNSLLPRRRAAQEKSGLAVSSAFDDNLDDDIEEFTL